MDIDQLIQLLQIGWPAIVTVAFVVLARLYVTTITQVMASQEARIKALEDRLFDCLEGGEQSALPPQIG